MTLFDFSRREDTGAWSPVPDTVMGGISSGRLVPGPASAAVFEGTVSLESGGGFVSLRSAAKNYDLGAFDGISCRVRGDGKTYKLNIFEEDGLHGVAFQARFSPTASVWSEFSFPFAALVATFRGRALPDHPALQPSRIRAFGLIIADRQAGPFRLEIQWMHAYKD